MTRLAVSAPILAAAILAAVSLLAPQAAEADATDYWPQCSARQAERLAEDADTAAPEKLTAAANCCAAVVLRGGGGEGKLSLAKKGRSLAAKAVELRPNEAASQYALAVLMGLVTQNDPFYEQWADGLETIPKIQKHAAIAAMLDPKLNYGGPDRLLGELYSQAPAQPISIGDMKLAIQHFQKAVAAAPDFPDNRLELAEALIKKRQTAQACEQLSKIMRLDAAAQASRPASMVKAKKLKKHYCRRAARLQ